MSRAGYVLAGGRSSRMGRDKALLPVPGAVRETLGARAVRVLREACVEHVVALGHARGIPSDVPRIVDAVADAGPLGGIVALLASSLAERYVVVTVDMPFITAEHLRKLINASDAARAAMFELEGVVEPFPCVLPASARDDVQRAVDAGERRAGDVLRALSYARIAITDRAVMRNLNTPADFDDSASGTSDQ